MNALPMTLLALVLAGSASAPAPNNAPAICASETLTDLKGEIETATKEAPLAEDKAVEFATRALQIAKSAKDAVARGEAAEVGFNLRFKGTSAGLDKLRGETWDVLIAKDADEVASLAPLVSKYLKDDVRAAALAKKTKAPEIKAACAYVPLASLVRAEERSEKDTKKVVDGLNSIKKQFGTVVDPLRKKPWNEVCDDLLFPIEHLAIGAEVPEIEATDTAGVKFKLSDYRGKVVLLDFWGNW